jgi:hypothetical protein
MKRSLTAALALADAALPPPPSAPLSLAGLERRLRTQRARRLALGAAAAAAVSVFWLAPRGSERITPEALRQLAAEWSQLRADVAAVLPDAAAATEALRRRERAAAAMLASAEALVAFDPAAAERHRAGALALRQTNASNARGTNR